MSETSEYRFPDRDTWAEQRRTPYGDDVYKVVEAVSTRAADYATTAEITQASAELHDYWRRLGTDLRKANAAAVAAWPLHGHRARRRATVLALAKARDDMHPEARPLVEAAEELKHLRHLVNDAQTQLAEDGQLRSWTVDNADKRMPRDTCPTWRAIVARWRAARLEAGDTYAEEVRQRPVDDQAWRKELDRRAQIEAWRATGHGVAGRSA